jgi:hypothetical protein
MDYDNWIARERRIRLKLLTSSTVIQKTGPFRVCQDCEEICLCHENTCPNCGSDKICQEKLDDIVSEVMNGNRIRCLFRYKRLSKNNGA